MTRELIAADNSKTVVLSLKIAIPMCTILAISAAHVGYNITFARLMLVTAFLASIALMIVKTVTMRRMYTIVKLRSVRFVDVFLTISLYLGILAVVTFYIPVDNNPAYTQWTAIAALASGLAGLGLMKKLHRS